MRPRPKDLETKAEAKARGYEAEAEVEAKILASRPVWPRGFNISASSPHIKFWDTLFISEINRARKLKVGTLVIIYAY